MDFDSSGRIPTNMRTNRASSFAMVYAFVLLLQFFALGEGATPTFLELERELGYVAHDVSEGLSSALKALERSVDEKLRSSNPVLVRLPNAELKDVEIPAGQTDDVQHLKQAIIDQEIVNVISVEQLKLMLIHKDDPSKSVLLNNADPVSRELTLGWSTYRQEYKLVVLNKTLPALLADASRTTFSDILSAMNFGNAEELFQQPCTHADVDVEVDKPPAIDDVQNWLGAEQLDELNNLNPDFQFESFPLRLPGDPRFRAPADILTEFRNWWSGPDGAPARIHLTLSEQQREGGQQRILKMDFGQGYEVEWQSWIDGRGLFRAVFRTPENTFQMTRRPQPPSVAQRVLTGMRYVVFHG